MRARTDWRGEYLDGRTPQVRPADLRLMATGIEVTVDGRTSFWPYGEIRQTQGRYTGEEVRLERSRGESMAPSDVSGEALVVGDREFLVSLRQLAPRLSGGLYQPDRRSLRLGVTIGAGLAVVAIAAGLYLWGIPALARAVAERVPVAWEEQLGVAVVREIAPPPARCNDASRQARIDALVGRLAAALPGPPRYHFRVLVVRDDVVNALAAPGGFIVVFRGLLDRTDTPEELAGVLAHEMAHVTQRHATRQIVQHASTGLLVAALTGDVTGVMAYGLQAARTLGALQYGRLAEEEADREGLRLLLAAGIDPAGMIRFFEKIADKGGDWPAALKYLSSHPSLPERIARLKALAAERRAGPPIRRLDGGDWADVRRICPAPRP